VADFALISTTWSLTPFVASLLFAVAISPASCGPPVRFLDETSLPFLPVASIPLRVCLVTSGACSAPTVPVFSAAKLAGVSLADLAAQRRACSEVQATRCLLSPDVVYRGFSDKFHQVFLPLSAGFPSAADF
jgi:hypothetical protein